MRLTKFSSDNRFKKHIGGFDFIALDEVGRGCFAGPMIVVAVSSESQQKLKAVKILDSKKMSALSRKNFALKHAKKIPFGIGFVNNLEIDELGMTKATKLGIKRAIKSLILTAAGVTNLEIILFDGNLDFEFKGFEYFSLIKGDQKSKTIAVASNLAKIYRDNLMQLYNPLFVNYNFKKNVGYGTPDHIESLRSYGPSRIHRKLFLRKLNG
jgi:ribonuclease HII